MWKHYNRFAGLHSTLKVHDLVVVLMPLSLEFQTRSVEQQQDIGHHETRRQWFSVVNKLAID